MEQSSTKEDIHGRRAQKNASKPDPTSDERVLKKYMDAWSGRYKHTHLNSSNMSRGYGSKVTWRNIFSKCKGSVSCYLKYLFGSSYTRNSEYDEENFPECKLFTNHRIDALDRI